MLGKRSYFVANAVAASICLAETTTGRVTAWALGRTVYIPLFEVLKQPPSLLL